MEISIKSIMILLGGNFGKDFPIFYLFFTALANIFPKRITLSLKRKIYFKLQ